MLWYARGGMTEQVGEDRLFFRRPMRLELVDQLFQQRSSAFGGCIGQPPFGKAALHAALSFQVKEYIHLLHARFQLLPKFLPRPTHNTYRYFLYNMPPLFDLPRKN